MHNQYNPSQDNKPNMDTFMEAVAKQQKMIEQLSHKVDQLATHNKMLETQIANQTPSSSKPTIPSQPQQNPRGHANAIFLRSGKEVKGRVGEDTKQDSSLGDEEVHKEDEEKVDEEIECEPTVVSEKYTKEVEERDHALLKQYAKEGKLKLDESKPKKESKPYVPSLPFPERQAKPKLEQ